MLKILPLWYMYPVFIFIPGQAFLFFFGTGTFPCLLIVETSVPMLLL